MRRYSLPLSTMLVAMAACAPLPSDPPPMTAVAVPAFSPMTFFAGDTVGDGVLKIDLMRRRSVHVEGHGDIDADGRLVLVQRVREGSKPERTRTWHIRAIGDGRYTGTLSDAAGPVTVKSQGNVLRIAYVAKGGFPVRQSLFLQPGGQRVLNILVVRKLGIRIAALRETITRQ